jgi:hypothetical protein
MTYKQAKELQVGEPIMDKKTGEIYTVIQTFELLCKKIGIEFKDTEGFHAVCTHTQVAMLPQSHYNREIN